MVKRSSGMTSRSIFLLLVCLCMLSTSLAAPIRMSATARRKSNTKQLNNKLSAIASKKNERKLKKKKRKYYNASSLEGGERFLHWIFGEDPWVPAKLLLTVNARRRNIPSASMKMSLIFSNNSVPTPHYICANVSIRSDQYRQSSSQALAQFNK